MAIWIAKLDSGSAPVAPPACVAPGVDPARAARAMDWPDGGWRVVTGAEAAELQKPGPEEALAAQHRAFTSAIRQRLDDFAGTRGYDSADSMAKYLGCSVPKFAAEAACMRDAVAWTWAKGYEILNAVLAGERPMPTLEEALAELPVPEWPDTGQAGYSTVKNHEISSGEDTP